MKALENIAVRAARKAGDYLLQSTEKLGQFKAESKGANDYVSTVDRKAESIIINTIARNYPDHAILAEESGSHGEHEYQWVIDPLDGTTNFLHGIPHYAVSIAVRHKGRTQVGVIFDPVRNELFTATRGSGAQLNNQRLRVSRAQSLRDTILSTGFPFRNKRRMPEYQRIFNALFEDCSDMRRAGSAALDLAWVAAGRVDGFWEFDLSDWDTAAGALMVSEAGGMVGDLSGNPGFDKADSILAANPKLYKVILQKIR